MKKERIDIEYPLSSRQIDIVWQLISTDHGLGRWLADEVAEDNGIISFTWGQPWSDHHTQEAYIVERSKNSHIRFKWVDEDDPEAYWEMKIGKSELTGDICLSIVDYAPKDEVGDLRALWDDNMERLHMTSGL
jgi:uncharacterized protein YndB with AHSA1/START domain